MLNVSEPESADEPTMFFLSDSETFDAAESSNPELFSVSDETGEWVITSYQAFDTDEWMKVTIGGVVYTIAVTDAQKQTVTYIERYWDGTQVVAEEKTAEVQSFPGSTTIRPGWYYIDEHYKTISNRISLTGDTHFILKSNSGSGLNYAWLDVQGLYIPQFSSNSSCRRTSIPRMSMWNSMCPAAEQAA